MAVYNPVLTYTFRDTLGNSDPNKVIKGAYLDGEFTAIHTASLDAASLSSSNTFTGGNVFNAGTTFVSGVTFDALVNLTGPLAVGTPATGTALSVTGTNTQSIAIFGSGSGATTAASDVVVARAGSTANQITEGPNLVLDDTTNFTLTALQHSGGQTELWQFNSSWNQILKVLTTRGVAINAPASGSALSITGVAGQTVLNLIGGTAQGALISLISGSQVWDIGGVGTTTEWSVYDAPVAVTKLKITAGVSGTISGYGPVAANLVDMTPDSGSWTTTLSGPYTSNPTGTLKWKRVGSLVNIWAEASITGTTTSNALINISALPAAITPSVARHLLCCGIVDAGFSDILGSAYVLSTGVITLGSSTTPGAGPPEGVNTSFRTGNVGTGIALGWSISYSL